MQGDVPNFVDVGMPGRIEIEEHTGAVSVTTPDYRSIVGIRQRLRQFRPSLCHVEFATDRRSSRIIRLGRGEAQWQDNEG
jgi:hypothetical protein